MTYFLLTNNSLQIFSKSNQLSLSFSPEVVRFQEIIDRKAFETQIKNFFAKTNSGEAIFFLSDEVVFTKAKENSTISNIDEEILSFFEKIPFQEDFLAKKIIRLKKQTFFFAAHRDYFTTIVHMLKGYGWDIKHIIPLPLFQSLTEGKQMTYSLLANITKNKHILEASDFSQEYVLQEEKDFSEQPEDGIPEEAVESKVSFSFPIQTQYVVAVICLIFFGAALYFSYPILFPASVKKTTVTATPAVIRAPSPTAIPISTQSAQLSKSEIKIQILNGSGIAGQATIVKNSLIDLGFSHIDTGNAGETRSVSQVTFSSGVSETFQQQIVQELKKSLASLTTQQVASSGSYDVIIITGGPAQ